ncbi:MAG: hypothetical protein RLZZ423_1537 [Cyanobacteriota bacterium]|jgi:hypothetical protein
MPAIGQSVIGEHCSDQKRPVFSRSESAQQGSQRSDLQRQASAHEAAAAAAAAAGDLETSARLILQALDCERRAGGVGPQVLQLIKPRS